QLIHVFLAEAVPNQWHKNPHVFNIPSAE
ncbi:hypothetical protein A2U01_0058279, partial [Trifolium medium]|nr:hypothetical protein [Trifolium medium]